MIDWAITNRCNLNCLHCRGMAEEELKDETILRVAEEIPLLKPRWVIIEGGEPLLHQELFEIIKTIHKSYIKIYLISNGMLLDNNIARRFAELDVNLMISIDGADKKSYEKIRRGANFERLIKSVATANEYGILDSCTITIGKHNYHQIGGLFQFAKDIGYKKIIFLGLKPCINYEKYILNEEEYQDFFFSVIRNQADYQIDVYVDEPFFKPFLKEHNIDYPPNPENGIIVPDVSRCIFGDYMFIETNGDIKPCTFAHLTIGNVNERSLKEIWEDMQNSKLIKMTKDFSTREASCRKCRYLYECGGCRSRTFNLTGNWSGTDPSCPLRKERIV